MTIEKQLLVTLTGEIYQPARLHYHFEDKQAVINALSKLRCIAFDLPQNRWVWLYRNEAKSLKFKISYYKIPKEKQPMAIGELKFRHNELVLDVPSFERASKAIIFFDEYLSQENVLAKDITIVNKLFEASESVHPDLGIFFDRDDIEKVNSDDFLQQMKQKACTETEILGKLKAFTSFLENNAKKPLPEIEKMVLNFYEDGISSIEAALTVRRAVAIEHWQGNLDYTLFDYMQAVMKSSSKK